jgi:hypothetical protein
VSCPVLTVGVSSSQVRLCRGWAVLLNSVNSVGNAAPSCILPLSSLGFLHLMHHNNPLGDVLTQHHVPACHLVPLHMPHIISMCAYQPPTSHLCDLKDVTTQLAQICPLHSYTFHIFHIFPITLLHSHHLRDVTTQLAQIWSTELPKDESGAIVIDNVTNWIKRWV